MSNKFTILTRAIYGGQPHNQEFAKEAIMIGKGEANDLIINAPGVSGVHAIIKLSGNSLTIQDLGSTNGTYVNGEKISEPTVITGRDTVTIGQAEMRAKIKTVATSGPVARPQAVLTPLPVESTPVEAPPKTSSFSKQDDDYDDSPAERTVVGFEVPTFSDQPAREPIAEVEPAAKVSSKPLKQPHNVETPAPAIQAHTAEPAQQEVNAAASVPASLADDDKPDNANKVLEVSLLWGEQLMAVNHYRKGRTVFIGDNKKNDFKIEGQELFGTDKFPFIVPAGDGYLLQITEPLDLTLKNKDGQLIANKQELLRSGHLHKSPNPAPKPVYGYPIKLEDHITVDMGELTFAIRYVTPAKWIPLAFSNSLDFYFSKVIGISLVVHLFLVLALLFTPKMPEGLDDKLFQDPDRFANLIIQPPPVKKSKDEFKLEQKIEKARPQANKTVEKERFGKVEEKKVVAAGKKGPAVDIDKRERDQKRALNAGIFSALKGSKGAASVFGGGGLGAGINNAVATLQGPSQNDAGGMGGLGSRGTGGAYGGGGLGIGGLGSGVSGGGGGGAGVGLAGREKSGYSLASGRTRVEGGLSQAEVAKVLQRAQSQIRYCYEKELQKNPNLDGKIVTIFKIGPNGRVIQSSIGSESTLDDGNVKSCVLNVIQKLIFPQPRGGGVVDVNYPWLFKRSG